MQTNRKTIRLTQLALLAAIEVILTFTPLGFIPLPAFSVTTLHVPVIIGAILLGPLDGGILGAVMGVCSITKATIAPSSPLSYLVSPFSSGNPLGSLITALGARIMIGVVAGYVYEFLRKKEVPTSLSVAVSAICGTITNTILFLGGMMIFFNYVPFVEFLAIIVGVNTVSETIVAVVISVAVCIPVMRYMKKKVIVREKSAAE